MFTLDIPTNKMDQFDTLMNESNVVYRVEKKDDSVTTIKVKRQKDLDKAQVVLSQL